MVARDYGSRPRTPDVSEVARPLQGGGGDSPPAIPSAASGAPERPNGRRRAAMAESNPWIVTGNIRSPTSSRVTRTEALASVTRSM